MRCRSGRVLKPRPKECEESYVYATILYLIVSLGHSPGWILCSWDLLHPQFPILIYKYTFLFRSQSYNLRTIYVFSFFFSLHVTLKRSAGKGKTRCPNVWWVPTGSFKSSSTWLIEVVRRGEHFVLQNRSGLFVLLYVFARLDIQAMNVGAQILVLEYRHRICSFVWCKLMCLLVLFVYFS